jgi:superfamily I DNA/RNA helicase
MGDETLGRLGRMYVGTIHGYCYRILTEHKLELVMAIQNKQQILLTGSIA